MSLATELVKTLDASSNGLIEDRILRAIVFLAKGNLDNFQHAIDLCRTDFRDLLWQAEYDCGDEQLYDFKKTFHEFKLMDK